jgi:hypothetical protein
MRITELINKNFNSIVMGAIALHSLAVGLLLIFLPMDMISLFGFKSGEQFFTRQGGALHVAASVAYFMAAADPAGNRNIIIFSAAVKSIAVIFLFSYYILVESIMLVLLSAIGDLGMAVVILVILYRGKRPT